jgi:hypothetical protein
MSGEVGCGVIVRSIQYFASQAAGLVIGTRFDRCSGDDTPIAKQLQPAARLFQYLLGPGAAGQRLGQNGYIAPNDISLSLLHVL